MKTFPCPHCDTEEFESKENLAQHIRLYHTSHRAKPSCYICGKLFNKREGVEHHGKTTHRELCEVYCGNQHCRRVFMLKSELKNHKILCPKIFADNNHGEAVLAEPDGVEQEQH